MITKEQAETLAVNKIKELGDRSRIKLSVLKDATKAFEYGWMFFYQSEEYVRTGNLNSLVGGNAPIIIDKFNASCHIAGTSRESDFYIEKYCELRDDPDAFENAIK